MANEKHFRDVPKKVRLIDANALIESKWWDSLKDDFDKARAKIIVQSCPTVDAIEVVRCKDCRHWQERWKGKYSDEWHGYCDLDDEPAGRWESDFCSYGERREG